jgi:hypothetical protein
VGPDRKPSYCGVNAATLLELTQFKPRSQASLTDITDSAGDFTAISDPHRKPIERLAFGDVSQRRVLK